MTAGPHYEHHIAGHGGEHFSVFAAGSRWVTNKLIALGDG
jgi:hypothetical protein